MARLSQDVSLNILQKQSLLLTNKMKLSLKIATLPVLDLRQEVLQALDENIALEWVDEQHKMPLESSLVKKDDFKKKNISTHYASSTTSFDDVIPNLPEKAKTLKDDLLFQVGCVKAENEVLEVARTIIQNLDVQGLNIVPIGELFAWIKQENRQPQTHTGITSDVLRRAHQIVHFLQPEGCACENTQDYILFQLYMMYKETQRQNANRNSTGVSKKKFIINLAVRLVAKHFSLLDEACPAKLKTTLEKSLPTFPYTLGHIKEALLLLSELKPYPSYQCAEDERCEYIMPDAYVTCDKDELVISVNNYVLPHIKINKEIEELAKEKSEQGKIARRSVQEGRDLISSIQERENTLVKVLSSIIVFQRDFFYYGLKYLSPLRQKDIAKELNLSPSTVSRITQGKYLSCKWGTFPINYFFSHKATTNQTSTSSLSDSGYASHGYSKQACKEIIRNICESNPAISDNKIACLLAKKGIKLARRTITKYRNEMGIKISHKR